MKNKYNILAINSSASSGSIALAKDGKIVQVSYLDIKRTHSERLMPMIDLALKQNNLHIADLDLICVAIGPGSFTGIRIAMATAKGISYSHKIPILPFDNLSLLAANLFAAERKRLVMIDARMGEVYTALYSKYDDVIIPPKNCKPEEILSEIAEPVIIIGDGAEKYYDSILVSKIDFILAAPHQNLDLASTMLSKALELEKIPEYDFEYIAKIEPNYLRKSQAETEKERREKNDSKTL